MKIKLQAQVFFVISLILLAHLSFGQNNYYRVKGKVLDSMSKEGIANFNITVSNNDHKEKNIAYTINDGVFVSNQIPIIFDKIILTSLGYKKKSMSLNTFLSTEINLGNIFLTKKIIELSEVEIKSRPQLLVMDSLKFDFCDSLFTGAKMTADVLKLIPGLQIVKNEVFYNGLNIKDLKVNGQRFFFNENDLLLNNLPGFSIERIEIVKPNSKQKKYLNEQPHINVILKKEFNKGYLVKALTSYGIKDKRVLDVFAGKMSPLYQLGIATNNNNVNDKDPLALENIYSIGGLSNSTDAKITFIKSIKKLEIGSDFSRSAISTTNIQETSRVDNIDGQIINSSYINSSVSKIKKEHFFNYFQYKLKSNSILKLNQDISWGTDGFLNTTLINSASDRNRQYSIENNTSSFKIKNVLDYNYKDLNHQNKILNIAFQHSYNDLRNSRFGSEMTSNVNKNVKSNELSVAASLTYLFNQNMQLVSSVDQNINYLNQTTPGKDNSNYRQFYNSIKLRFGGTIGKMDYSITLGNYFYDFNPALRNGLKYNTILPVINFNYLPMEGVKLGLGYTKVVNPIKLEQLAKLTLDNDFLIRVENYNVVPETSEAYELNFEKVGNRKKIFLNMGYLRRKDIAENTFLGEETPLVVLRNIGSVSTLYVTSRQELNVAEAISLTGYLNYNNSTQNPDLNGLSKTKTTLLECNIGFQYKFKKKAEVLLINGISKSIRVFDLNQSRYETLLFNSSIRASYEILPTTTLSMNTVFQYNKTDISTMTNGLNTIMDVSAQRTFLKNKNLIVFLKGHDLFDNRTRNFQEYNSGASVQSLKISTIGRYFLFGLTYKLNTLSR